MKIINTIILASCFFIFYGCKNHKEVGDLKEITNVKEIEENIKSGANKSDTPEPIKLQEIQNPNIFCWTGLMDSKIPVKLWYQIFGDVLVGEILYPESKAKIGIPIIGTIDENKYIELREFDKSGMITGHISGIPLKNKFNPEWFNPSNQKMSKMELTISDSIVKPISISADLSTLKGRYYYAFGQNGYSGDLEVVTQEGSQIEVRILSTTGELSGYNIAELESSEASLVDNKVIIKYPYNENCTITIYFYNGFVKVEETNCSGEFGHNATLAGIYYKIKN